MREQLPAAEVNLSSPPSKSWRKRLPAKMIAKELSLWTILKQSMGKDLTRFSIPVVFNEPLSFLQRLAEYMEYSHLLKTANSCQDSIERFEFVVAFIISSLSSNYKRLSKPFNPLWFETYELDRLEEDGYRFVAEQVSHHPPVSAFHVESDFYEFYGTVSPRLKFWGTSIEVSPNGKFELKLTRTNEVYEWSSVNMNVYNIIMGEMYIKLDGQLIVRCASNNLEYRINFVSGEKDPTLDHYFFHASLLKLGKEFKYGYGNWASFFAIYSSSNFQEKFKNWIRSLKYQNNTDFMSLEMPLIEGSKTLWKCNVRPEHSSTMYNFTEFTYLLNDPNHINSFLPRTDCRLRPDMRLLELGDTDGAAKEKSRLEVKQREAREKFKKTNTIKNPKWFKKQQLSSDGPTWIYNCEYWDGIYSNCEDIY